MSSLKLVNFSSPPVKIKLISTIGYDLGEDQIVHDTVEYNLPLHFHSILYILNTLQYMLCRDNSRPLSFIKTFHLIYAVSSTPTGEMCNMKL